MIQFRTFDIELTQQPRREFFPGNFWHLRSAGGAAAILARFGPDGVPSEVDEKTTLHLPWGGDFGWVWLSLVEGDALAKRTVSIQHGAGAFGMPPPLAAAAGDAPPAETLRLVVFAVGRGRPRRRRQRRQL